MSTGVEATGTGRVWRAEYVYDMCSLIELDSDHCSRPSAFRAHLDKRRRRN